MSDDFTANLPSLLGQPVDDARVAQFLAALDPRAKLRRNESREPRWASDRAGVEIHGEEASRRITGIYLYAEGYEGSRQYQGALPHGVTFAMSKAQVQACFPRPPDATSAEHDAWDFDDYRFIVMYDEDTGAIITVHIGSDM